MTTAGRTARTATRRTAAWLLVLAALVGVLGYDIARYRHDSLTIAGEHNVTAARAGLLGDYRDAGYYPTTAVLDGNNPYDVGAYTSRYPVGAEFSPYAPSWLLLNVPFTLLPYRVAAWTFWAFDAAAALAVAWLALRATRHAHDRLAVLMLATLLLASVPGQINQSGGQPTFLVVAACLLVLQGRTLPFAWFALGATGVLFKPQFGLPLLMLVAVWWGVAGWRRLLGGMAVAVGACLPVGVALLVEAGGPVHLVRTVLDSASASEKSLLNDLASSRNARLDLASTLTFVARPLAHLPGLEVLCGAAVLLGAGLVLRWACRSGTRADLAVPLIGAAVLLAIAHQPQDALLPLSLAAIPLADPRPGPLAAAQVPLVVVTALFRYDLLHDAGLSGSSLEALCRAMGISILFVAAVAAATSRRAQRPVTPAVAGAPSPSG